MPTLMRKKGMKRALPTNSKRFMSTEDEGIRRLSDKPATKAPMMGSTPATWARKAAKNTAASTKM
jgi:hypothetical protein